MKWVSLPFVIIWAIIKAVGNFLCLCFIGIGKGDIKNFSKEWNRLSDQDRRGVRDCKACKMEIPQGGSICPYCRTKLRS